MPKLFCSLLNGVYSKRIEFVPTQVLRGNGYKVRQLSHNWFCPFLKGVYFKRKEFAPKQVSSEMVPL